MSMIVRTGTGDVCAGMQVETARISCNAPADPERAPQRGIKPIIWILPRRRHGRGSLAGTTGAR